MIVWTVFDIPVNLDAMAAQLAFKRPILAQAIGRVVSESFRLNKEFDEHLPEGACLNCGGTLDVNHNPGICEDCVQTGLAQCDCCTVRIDLTYLFNKYHVTVKFQEETNE